MEAMRQSWTDDRLDSLNEKVERRFDEVDRRFDEVERRFDEVDRRIDEIREDFREARALIASTAEATQNRLETIQRSMIYLSVSLTAGMLAGFGGMAALLAARV
jgi:chromosome segregation ATPase